MVDKEKRTFIIIYTASRVDDRVVNKNEENKKNCTFYPLISRKGTKVQIVLNEKSGNNRHYYWCSRNGWKRLQSMLWRNIYRRAFFETSRTHQTLVMNSCYFVSIYKLCSVFRPSSSSNSNIIFIYYTKMNFYLSQKRML